MSNESKTKHNPNILGEKVKFTNHPSLSLIAIFIVLGVVIFVIGNIVHCIIICAGSFLVLLTIYVGCKKANPTKFIIILARGSLSMCALALMLLSLIYAIDSYIFAEHGTKIFPFYSSVRGALLTDLIEIADAEKDTVVYIFALSSVPTLKNQNRQSHYQC